MLLGMALVGWVSYGVLNARTVRVILAWIAFPLFVLVAGIAVLDDGTGSDLVQLLFALAELGAFIAFVRTPYFAWRSAHPREQGPSLAGVVTLALIVGALGGVIGADPEGPGFHISTET